ncbi:DUF4199 domain-containing protein [uncultured Maribacter sp.]|uniref:DUF4199 domain-containing protein n=1 Tax=uncultured Maribacter sp. TaxID=431308 RepID=UPI002634E38D|nr:DUF4199 domain-containing protein [uncultured Maribacter sp.]
MKLQNHLEDTLLQGVIMGLAFCFYTVFMWLTRLDTTYLHIGQYFDMAIIILPLLMIFWAIKQENQKQKINLFKRILIAIFVGLISFIIYDPFLYIYHHFLNPNWFSSVLSLKEANLIAVNTDPNLIAEQLKNMKDTAIAQSALFRPSAIIPSVLIVPTLIALLSLVFIRQSRLK